MSCVVYIKISFRYFSYSLQTPDAVCCLELSASTTESVNSNSIWVQHTSLALLLRQGLTPWNYAIQGLHREA